MTRRALHRRPTRALLAAWLGLLVACALAAPARAEVALGSMTQLTSAEVSIELISVYYNRRAGERTIRMTLTNVSGAPLEGSLYVAIDNLTAPGAIVANADEQSEDGLPVFVIVDAGTFTDGESIVVYPLLANVGRSPVGFDATAFFAPVITDTTPPALTADVAAYTAQAEIAVAGTVTDAESAIAGVVVTVDTAPDAPVDAAVAPDGAYAAGVPLGLGPNVLTVTATDTAGNAASTQRIVTRVEPPTMTIGEPAEGERVFSSSVTVRGEIQTTLPASTLSVRLGEASMQPDEPVVPGAVAFRFDDVRLAPGLNRLNVLVETPVGTIADSVDVERRIIAVGGDTTGPALTIERPLPGSIVETDVVVVTGRVDDPSGVDGVTVAGGAATTRGAADTVLRFEASVDIASASGPVVIEVRATDVLGNASTAQVELERDTGAPTLGVADLSPAPAVNLVTESPYRLSGTVTDANLASLLINGRAVGLVPGSAAGTYDFEALIALVPGQTQSVTVEARDLAGNLADAEFVLRTAVEARLEILSPLEGAEILASGGVAAVEVIARVGALPAGAVVEALADGGPPAAMAADRDIVFATVDVAGDAGVHELAVQILSPAGDLLRLARVSVDIVDRETLPVDLARHEPDNGARDVGLFEPVTLHFNKPIVLARLEVVLRETAHGLTYAAAPDEPAAFGGRGAELVEVHRDRELVAANLAPLPGDRMVSVFPERDFAFGATVFVEVLYEGFSLARFSYETQPLPTFVQGLVGDQLLEPVAGISVSLPDLGFAGTTNNDGAFNLGSGEPGAPQIPPGRHRLVFNAGLANRAFGTLEKWANVQAQRLNSIGLTVLPVLNPDVPFQRIASGQPRALLAGADLELDLSAVTLEFPDGRDAGDVHVQFTSLDQIPHTVSPGAPPHWVFAVQPAGVRLTGSPAVRLRIPPLFGSLDYAPADGTRVVLVGFNAAAKQVVPVGVGVIAAGWVESEGEPALDTLDYLGYALVEPALQDTLSQHAFGELTLAQLIAALEAR